MKRTISSAATITLITVGLVGLTQTPAQAGCAHGWSNKDATGGTANWSNAKLRTGPHNNCSLDFWVPGGAPRCTTTATRSTPTATPGPTRGTRVPTSRAGSGTATSKTAAALSGAEALPDSSAPATRDQASSDSRVRGFQVAGKDPPIGHIG